MHYLSFKNYRFALSRQIRLMLSAFALLFVSVQYANGQAVTCPPNIDFSYGLLTNWLCYTGSCVTGTPTTGPFVTVSYSGPVINRHEITSGSGTDPYGGFSVTAPGGGLFSLKLGNNSVGAEAERVQYYVHVPIGFNNYSFAFKYAVVFEDPMHNPEDQPAFKVIAYDSATGSPIPCATLTYISGAGLPGFFTSPSNSGVQCLAWTNGTLNLSGQGGKTIIVEATSNDCAPTGHFGYGYFDVISCGQFAAAITYCNLSANLLTLAAPAGYKSYKWYKGPTISGAPISTAQSFNTTPPNPCNFFFCVLQPFNSNGCPDTIRTRNICDFAVTATPDTVCNSLGNPIQLNITAAGGLGGFKYNWLSDPTLSCTNCQSPIATPSSSGFYVGFVTDSVGCQRADTVVIQNPSFKLNLGPDITTCLGSPIVLRPSLTPPGPGFVFKWTPGTNLSNTTILNPTFTPSAIGQLTYALRVDSGVCATSDTIKIRTITNTFNLWDTAICEGYTFTPRVTGDPTLDSFKFTWVPNVNIVAGSGNGRYPRVIADTTRTYFATAKYGTCPDIVRQVTFTVEPSPRVDLGADSIQKCLYTPLYLTAHVLPAWFNKYSYQWRANDMIDNVNSPIITYNGMKDTTLLVTVTTPLGCNGQDSVRVQVYQGSFGSVTPSDTAVCPRNPITMVAGGGTSYLWRPSLYLSDSTSSTVTANPVTSTDYTLFVKDRNGCVDTLPVSLKVYSEALVSLPDSAVLYPGNSYQLDPGGNALYFSWFPTVGLSNSNVSNPVATPSVNTRYYVTGTTEAGCTAMDSIYILVHEESVLNMANAFTPGVAPNPEFKVSHMGIASLKSFRIYNRWGAKVFETSDIDKGWNGQFNGEPQPMGAYIYTVEAVTNKGKVFTKQGNVTLIR